MGKTGTGKRSDTHRRPVLASNSRKMRRNLAHEGLHRRRMSGGNYLERQRQTKIGKAEKTTLFSQCNERPRIRGPPVAAQGGDTIAARCASDQLSGSTCRGRALPAEVGTGGGGCFVAFEGK